MFFKKILALGITVERLTDVRKENRLLDYQKNNKQWKGMKTMGQEERIMEDVTVCRQGFVCGVVCDY